MEMARADLGAIARRSETSSAPAHERLLPVLDVLGDLLPTGQGLRRGSAVTVAGPAAVSLALALAAGPGRAGSWIGVLGLPGLGLAAAAELGVPLQRLLMVATPPPNRWAEILAVLADGVDVVIAQAPKRIAPGEARRLQARVATRGSVLLLVESNAPCADTMTIDVRLTTAAARWNGLGRGSGRLMSRCVDIDVAGRRSGRPRSVRLLLPGPEGVVSRLSADEGELATVTPLRKTG